MPTTIYDSSLIIKRNQDKTIANSFISRIQNGNNSTTGSAPILGVTEQSIINYVKSGQMIDFRENSNGCMNINRGCPCNQTSSPVIRAIIGWVTTFQGNGTDLGNSIATDSSGNVYVTGVYRSTTLTINNFVSGGDGSPIILTPYGTLSNIGGADTFIIKYNTVGQAQWVTNLVGTLDDVGRGISTDSTGNVYVIGNYNSNPLTINNFVSGGDGNPISLTSYGTLTNNGFNDIFIVKYNTNGQAEWATSIQGTGSDSGITIVTNSSGNVYVMGTYTSTSLTINSFVSSGTPINLISYGTLSNSGSNDTFIVKYNTGGQAQWATSIQGTTVDSGINIATDNSGSVYVVGLYESNPLTINSFVSSGTPINLTAYGTLSNSGLSEGFIVKYNTNGQAQWATSIQGTGTDLGSGVATDSFGNVYVSGYYNSTSITINNFVSSGTPINLTPYGTLSNIGSYDIYIVKYNSNGQAQWATSIQGTNFDFVFGSSVATDGFGNVYLLGLYNSTSLTINSFVSGGGGSPINVISYGTLTNTGLNESVIVKYDTNGQAQWATALQGTNNNQGNSIATDSSGNIYITGTYSSNPMVINNFVSGGGGNPINLTVYGTLSNSGTPEGFIVRYNTNGQVS